MNTHVDIFRRETLSAASVLCDAWSRSVIDTATSRNYPELRESAQRALDAMAEFRDLAMRP